ncbi:MAG: hypothetical protein ACQESP_11870 [Candidatus Muiribacteriota bacterium]
MNLHEVLEQFATYFTESAGIRKFFSSTVSLYDYFLVLLAFGLLMTVLFYFLYPVIRKKILDYKFLQFVFFYKNINNEEKNFLNMLMKNYKIDPKYKILISKKEFQKISDKEIKNMMLKHENENKIRDAMELKAKSMNKLFSK